MGTKKKKKTELKDLRGFKQMPCFYHNLPFMFPLFINEKKKNRKLNYLSLLQKKKNAGFYSIPVSSGIIRLIQKI